jgi:hypothetical protein
MLSAMLRVGIPPAQSLGALFALLLEGKLPLDPTLQGLLW